MFGLSLGPVSQEPIGVSNGGLGHPGFSNEMERKWAVYARYTHPERKSGLLIW